MNSQNQYHISILQIEDTITVFSNHTYDNQSIREIRIIKLIFLIIKIIIIFFLTLYTKDKIQKAEQHFLFDVYFSKILTAIEQRLPRPLHDSGTFRKLARDSGLMQVCGEPGRLHADQVPSNPIDNGLEDFVPTVPVHGLVQDDTSDTEE